MKDHNIKKTTAIVFLTLLGLNLYGNDTNSSWATIYEDNYNYSKQSSKNNKFNTWFWREDSAATHYFEYTDNKGCDDNSPCVKLTAQAYPSNKQYTNSEMYNNSCVNNLQLLELKNNVWSEPLYNNIYDTCSTPYPYQKDTKYLTPFNLTSSWNNLKGSYLETNPLALSSGDIEKPWKALRDITFNNPYHADKNKAIRIVMDIKAETKDQGGSRGWGFWNTSLDPDFLQLAWFMEYSIPDNIKKDNKSNRAVVMQSIGKDSNDQLKICSTILDPVEYDIYKWHTYKIEWRDNGVLYFVDGNLVATHKDIFLKKHMAFHNWVDNRNYTLIDKMIEGISNFPLTKDKSNYIKSYKVETSDYSNLPHLKSSTPKCSIIKQQTILEDILKMAIKDYL